MISLRNLGAIFFVQNNLPPYHFFRKFWQFDLIKIKIIVTPFFLCSFQLRHLEVLHGHKYFKIGNFANCLIAFDFFNTLLPTVHQ